jgi:malate dehydrogenase (oxaloacetate-decarboxylating)
VASRLPSALVQWEDFAQQNARRLLGRHRNRICSFNDDVQGTAAVTAAAVRSGLRRTGVAPHDLQAVIVGAGSAGTGVADELVRFLVAEGMAESDAIARCWLIDRDGLLHDGMHGLHDFQHRYARRQTDVPGTGSLLDVVAAVGPQALVGVSGQPGLFSEAVVRTMVGAVPRPIVLPLSNPTPRAEAIPSDVLAWSEGRALVGTGSPFPPVSILGREVEISQVNNISVFPGIGLGVVAVGAQQVTDPMITAATGAVADLAAALPGERLLPPVEAAGRCAVAVARSVARVAVAEGVCPTMSDDEVDARIDATIWMPGYEP